MFKTAATKIAHNSTLQALGGNQDLRPLQDLITAEKAVIVSLQKLAVDYSKAAEALRAWGSTEGDDLGDILGGSTVMLNHFSSALSQYATHGHTIRESLKTIRTREEALDELKRRRRTVMRKADDAERKLSKMGPEHKHLAMQTETLNRLRDEIRIMDSDIMIEEAAIGDFKRVTTKAFLGLKFGGLVECCDKGSLAGEYGRLIVTEIPEEPTQPGLPRPYYYGQNKTSSTLAEGSQKINEVQLITVPTAPPRDRKQYTNFPAPGLPLLNNNPGTPSMGYQSNDSYGWSSDSKPLPPPRTSNSSDQLSPPNVVSRPFAIEAPESPTTPHTNSSFSNFTQNTSMSNNPPTLPPLSPAQSQGSRFQPPPPGGGSGFSQTYNPASSRQQYSSSEGPGSFNVDEFGAPRSAGPMDNLNGPAGPGTGGRFATFPVKGRLGGSLDAPSPGGLNKLTAPASPTIDVNTRSDDLGLSFSASIAEALGDKTVLDASGPSNSTSAGARSSNDGSVPSIDVVAPNNPFANLGGSAGGIPPGAAPPDPNKKWISEDTLAVGGGASGHRRTWSDNDDALLAYMTSVDLESEAASTPPHSATFAPAAGPGVRPPPTTTMTSGGVGPGKLSVDLSSLDGDGDGEDRRVSRHVRFGQVEDVDEELERRSRASEDKERSERMGGPGGVHYHQVSPMGQTPPTTAALDAEFAETEDVAKQRRRGFVPQSPPRNASNNTTNSNSNAGGPMSMASKPVEEEKALDLAAAKEIARELESLKGSQPNTPTAATTNMNTNANANTSTSPPRFDSLGRSDYPTSMGPDNNRSSPPLAPPKPPFAQRGVSPHPYADLNPTSQIPPFTAAQAYAQSYQDANTRALPQELDYGPTTPTVPLNQGYEGQGQGQGQPPLSPAQAYAQSYQQSRGALPPSSLGNNSMVPSGGPLPSQNDTPNLNPNPNANIYIPNSNTLPPRFQALQQQAENAKPPRFQNQQGQPQGQGTSSTLPPRFQNAGRAPSPSASQGGPGGGFDSRGRAGSGSGVGLGGGPGGPGGPGGAGSPYGPLGSVASASGSRLSALGAGAGPSPIGGGGPGGPGGAGESPYRLGIPTTFNRSATSLTNPHSGPPSAASSPIIPPLPAGARTISAAAFKRPMKNTSVDNLLPPLGSGAGPGAGAAGEGGPGGGGFKRMLPTSPYPVQQNPSGPPYSSSSSSGPGASGPGVDRNSPPNNQRPSNDSDSSLPLPSGMGGHGSPPGPSPPPILDPIPASSTFAANPARHSVLPQLGPGATQRPLSELPDDFQYDYINAYIGGSPQRDDVALPDPYANAASQGPGQGGRLGVEQQGSGMGQMRGHTPEITSGGNLAGWGRPKVGTYSDTNRVSRHFDDLR